MSHDLGEWTTVQSYYGLGQEIVVSLWCEQDLVNPPDPEGLPPSYDDLPQPVTLILRSVTDEPGLLVSWTSLEDGTAVQYYLPSTSLDARWSMECHPHSHGDH